MEGDPRQLYRALFRARRFDEMSLALQRQGAIDAYGSARGQEAAHIGAAVCLEPEDWLFPSYRQPGAMLERGVAPRELWAHYGGLQFVGWDMQETRCGPYTVPLATQLSHATGMAWGIKVQGRDEVVMVFFGDGASSQGEAHEAMNYAGRFKVPVVFVCENNGWAISVPWSEQTAAEHVADRAQGYGFPGVVVDGQDAMAVRAAAQEAVDRARDGGGPTLIEAKTIRLGGHTTSDDPNIYRPDEQLEEWRARDPVALLETNLFDEGLLSEQDISDISDEVEAELRAAVSGWQKERGLA